MILNLKDYNRLILKEIIILMPKFKENMLSFLAPIIGIYGIKINLFIDEFILKTEYFDIDLIIPLKVIIFKINTFDFVIQLPYINFFLNEFYNNINILYIYKLSLLKSINNYKFSLNNYKLIRGYIKSLYYVKNKFKLIKFNFFIFKKVFLFNKLKLLYNNFNFFFNYSKYSYGIYININNLNFQKIENNILCSIFILKIKKYINLYLISLNNLIDLNIFIKNLNLYIKNKYKIISIKFYKNNLNLIFFNNLIKESYNVLNYFYLFNNLKLYNFYFKFIYVIFNFLKYIKLYKNA